METLLRLTLVYTFQESKSFGRFSRPGWKQEAWEEKEMLHTLAHSPKTMLLLLMPPSCIIILETRLATIAGSNATERCQTCDRVIFVIFTSYLQTNIQPSIKTATPIPVSAQSRTEELFKSCTSLEYGMFQVLRLSIPLAHTAQQF